MTPPRNVKSKKSQGKVRRVRAWAIVTDDTDYIVASTDKDTLEQHHLFWPYNKTIHCTITYQLPPSGRRKKEKRR